MKKEASKIIASVIILLIVGAFFITTNLEIVVSGSMEPTVKTGSLAVISKEIEEVKEGDIISYDLGSKKVLHRVIEVKKEGFITKGDNNKSEDFGIISNNKVNGKYLFSIPLIGYIILYLKKYLLVIIPILMIMYLAVKKVR